MRLDWSIGKHADTEEKYPIKTLESVFIIGIS